MQYKVTVYKFESSKERDLHAQELLISASHPRVALAKALRMVNKSMTLGKWSGQEGNLQMTYTRLTEREAKRFAATQDMQTIGGCA